MTEDFAYAEIGGGHCSDWVYLPEGGYPDFLDSSHPLSSTDPVEECMYRCLDAATETANGIGDQAFYVNSGGNCACASGSCSSQGGSSDSYTSYSILAPGSGQIYNPMRRQNHNCF